MRHLLTTVLATSTFLAVGAMSARAQDCSPIGKTWVENGVRYTCVPKGSGGQSPNSTAHSQADSERRSGASGCQYDGSGKCVKGSDLPRGNFGGNQSTQAAVFPGLTNDKWDRLQSSADGRALIKQADGLRDQQAQAKKAIDDIRFGPDAGRRQQDLIAATERQQSIKNSLSKMQGRADKIIERVTLERKQ